MFNALEQESVTELALVRCLMTAAAFIPTTILVAVVEALRAHDPKFGVGGAAMLTAYFMVAPFTGCLFAIVTASYFHRGRGLRAHLAFGSTFSLLAAVIVWVFASVVALDVPLALICASGAGAVIAAVFELSAGARRARTAG